MKGKWRAVLIVAFSIILILVVGSALLKRNTKKHSPTETVTFAENGLNIKIVYSRPYKKGRLIFGNKADGALQPFGVYWRLGANEATTFETDKDISFAGQPLKAGLYSIYAIPREKTWTVAINSDAKRWGYAEPNYEKDVLTASVPVTYSDDMVEQFKIDLQASDAGAEMTLKWDNSVVIVPISQ